MATDFKPEDRVRLISWPHWEGTILAQTDPFDIFWWKVQWDWGQGVSPHFELEHAR